MDVFLYYNDIIVIVIICLVFSILPIFHRILLPDMYSPIREFIYEGDVRKVIKSSVIRFLSVIIFTIIFNKYFLFSAKLIYLGTFISCFLNVWPAIIQYRLLNFVNSKEKMVCLFGYITYVGFSTLMAFITINLVSPMIYDNREFFLLDNSGMGIILFLVSIVIPVSIEAELSKIFSYIEQDIDSYREEVRIISNLIDFENRLVRIYEHEIVSICLKNNISKDLLTTIINLEHINRGSWYIALSEKFLCRYLPTIAIKKDISVGLTQIKISTAQSLLKKAPYKFISELITTEYNIDVCAQLLSKIINDYSDESIDDPIRYSCSDIYEYIANKYLCSEYTYLNRSVLIYTSILRSKCSYVFN